MDIGYIKATGHSVKIYLPKTMMLPEVEFEWKIPKWSNAIERDRARTYFQAYAAAAALHFAEKAMEDLHAGETRTWTEFKVPDEAIGCGFHEAVRGVLSHHVVIRDGKIANYHPYPPTPWNASPRDIYGTPGPYEDAVQNTPIFEENGPDKFKGIDIMRAVRSFDPCLPCGVHMYLGGGKLLDVNHVPMFGRRSKRYQRAKRERALALKRSLALAAGKGDANAGDARRERVPGGIAAPRCAVTGNRRGSPTRGAGPRPRLGAGRPRPARRRPGTHPYAPGRRPTLDACVATRSWAACCCCTGCIRWTWRSGCGEALEQVRPTLQLHGGAVELIEVDDGVVRLRLEGGCGIVGRDDTADHRGSDHRQGARRGGGGNRGVAGDSDRRRRPRARRVAAGVNAND